MKERPILFKGPLVRAILSGQKTVTRRLLKMPHGFWETSATGELVPIPANCPYGKPGDRLWVREGFGEIYDYCEHPEMPGCPDENWHIAWKYRADGDFDMKEWDGVFTGWKPSIHMPRAACRILLEITAVRVERLQDINDAEIEREGIDLDALADGQDRYDMCHAGSGADGRPTLRTAWRHLWESTGGDWDANPWVWVVEFKRVTP
ncbi:hypothetical protein [Pseudomonas sp. MF7448]|uniref:hypothetical protein n=1 Tax=Pseudomonas sp. MF7448 TaxID=2797537 RepID=UPI00190A1EB5|nr:hypothetical protein [Pseudomonas sp. MF7448]MBK3439301.1 hypothetical protein [Pseudomonas sp. MF7448]